MVRLEPVERRRVIAGQLVWFLIWVGVTAAALLLTPDPSGHGTHMQLGLPPCPSMLAFGKPCPGCGLTTSFTGVVHGELGPAIGAHPFGPILYAVLTIVGVAGFLGWIKKLKMTPNPRVANIGLIVLLGGFFVFGVARFFLATPQSRAVIALQGLEREERR